MKKTTRFLAALLALMMTLLLCPLALAGDISDVFDLDGEPLTINVYSQLANYSGLQGGWSADLLLDKFNVRINIIPDSDGTYETRMASGNLGDIIVWGADGEQYKNAVEKGMLLDWEEDGLLEEYAPYIAENYTLALENNRTISGDGAIHGFGHNVSMDVNGHESFFYTWDIRWDLYQQLGCPEVKDLDGMVDLFLAMKEICPTDDNGNETYALSAWPDWDGNMVMYVKALATAYYGYDELGIGLYDTETGEFYDCLAEDGPYMKCLRFFNKLYQNGLLDPNSMTQTFDQMSEKVKNSGTFWSIFNYAGSQAYNTTEHLAEGRYMYAFLPEEATPIAYGLSTTGGNRIWSIGADTEYPEVCLAIIDYLATPEGSMTMWYGPKGLTWDIDEEGGLYFTELGLLTNSDTKYDLTGIEFIGPRTGKTYVLKGNFNDGCLQINNTTLSQSALNPDSAKGETFDKNTWESVLTADSTPVQDAWREWSGFPSAEQYLENHGYKVMLDKPGYSEGKKDGELSVKWAQVTKEIVNMSWQAIYAKSDAAFAGITNVMRNNAKNYGYDLCVEWSRGQAEEIWAAQHPELGE